MNISLGVDGQFDDVIVVSPTNIADLAQQIGRAGRRAAAIVTILIPSSSHFSVSKNSLFDDIFDISCGGLIAEFEKESCCNWQIISEIYSNGEIQVDECNVRNGTLCSFCAQHSTHQIETALEDDDNDNDDFEEIQILVEKNEIILKSTANEKVVLIAEEISKILPKWQLNRSICLIHRDHIEWKCPLAAWRCFHCGSSGHQNGNCEVIGEIIASIFRVAIHAQVKLKKQITTKFIFHF